jgi:uncharacterized protein YndB with AHSA1/START domain
MSDHKYGAGAPMVLERIFDAPRELVFDCFIKPEHLAAWWGPRQFTAPVCEIDPRPGGKILIHMQGPPPYGVNVVDGEVIEVSPPARLVMVLRAFQGDDGAWGIEHIDTLTFEDIGGGRTRMTLVAEVTKVSDALKPALEGMDDGWNQSMDKLAELLPNIA